MKLKRTVAMLAAALLSIAAAGCATQGKFVEVMDGHIGLTEAELVAGYGPPNGAYTLPDGSKVLQFTQGEQVTVPGATITAPVTSYGTGTVTSATGKTAYYSGQSTAYVQQQAAPMTFDKSCTVNFTITKGRVSTWRASGNNCVSQ